MKTTIHHYHPVSREYLGYSEADESPLEPGEFLIPANATSVEPPAVPEGKVAVWNSVDWSVLDIPTVEDTQEQDAQPQPAPEIVVTPWQIREALNQLGLRGAVETYVAGADQRTKDAWEFAQEFKRSNPLIVGAIAALGKTPEEGDALFALAKTLVPA